MFSTLKYLVQTLQHANLREFNKFLEAAFKAMELKERDFSPGICERLE